MQTRIPGFLLHPGSPSFPCEGDRVRATSIPLRMSPLSSNGVGTTSSVPAPLLLENGGGRAFLKPPLPPPPQTPPLLPKGFHPYRIPHGGYTGEDEAGFGNWATLSKTCWKAEGNDWSKQGKRAMVSSLLGKGAAREGKGIASNRFALGIRSPPRRMHKSVFSLERMPC